MTDEDEPDVMLLLVSVEEAVQVAEGSITIVAGCGCECWIGVSSVKMLEKHGDEIQTTCLTHADKEKLKEAVEEHGGMYAPPGGLADLAKNMGDFEAFKVQQMFNVREKGLDA